METTATPESASQLNDLYHNVEYAPKAMLRVAGFRTVEDTPNPEIFVCRK